MFKKTTFYKRKYDDKNTAMSMYNNLIALKFNAKIDAELDVDKKVWFTVSYQATRQEERMIDIYLRP